MKLIKDYLAFYAQAFPQRPAPRLTYEDGWIIWRRRARGEDSKFCPSYFRRWFLPAIQKHAGLKK
jgi:hypothetical protein